MNYAAHPGVALKFDGRRAGLTLTLVLVVFSGLLARAVFLQGVHHEFLQQKGDQRYSRVIDLPANRGMITDRNGDPLAISTPMESIWVSSESEEALLAKSREVARLLKMDQAELEHRVRDTTNAFFPLKRQIPPDVAAKVMELRIPGVIQKREYRRFYPAGPELSHLLGFTDADNKGAEGVELAFDQTLAGTPGAKRVIKDRAGHVVEDVQSISAPQQGRDLALSIDGRLQYLAYRELKAAVATHRAKGGAIVVLDAQTGELLAVSNLPDYNPNDRDRLTGKELRNRALTDTFEPGSTLKPLTIAAALETGAWHPDTVVQTAPGVMTVGTATIHDAHPNGALTVAQVIQKSSNVGAAKIALSLKAEVMWDMFNTVGFGVVPQSGFPGEAKGRVRPYQSWRPIEQATMSYGHGIAVSLYQLVRAYTVFASAGELKPPSLLKVDGPVQGRRVLSETTARAVSDMLETVVQPGGTAPRGAVPGYRVAGKTGTAHKQQGGGYARDRYVSSFVGYAPASNPRLVIGVMIDEPTAGEYYGGTVAAPAFASLMAASLRALGVPPDAPTSVVPVLPEALPLVREDT